MTLAPDVLESYLRDMPRGHVFDLSYEQFNVAYPPGETDTSSRDRLLATADACGCDLADFPKERRFELTRRM